MRQSNFMAWGVGVLDRTVLDRTMGKAALHDTQGGRAAHCTSIGGVQGRGRVA